MSEPQSYDRDLAMGCGRLHGCARRKRNMRYEMAMVMDIRTIAKDEP